MGTVYARPYGFQIRVRHKLLPRIFGQRSIRPTPPSITEAARSLARSGHLSQGAARAKRRQAGNLDGAALHRRIRPQQCRSAFGPETARFDHAQCREDRHQCAEL